MKLIIGLFILYLCIALYGAEEELKKKNEIMKDTADMLVECGNHFMEPHYYPPEVQGKNSSKEIIL